MKKRIKSPFCTNCYHPLKAEDNYCPECGQENDNKRQSFGRVMSDLVQGFLSVDSRLAHSLPALLFRPGFLTSEYLKGRRQRYLDPVRMFITILVIYFLLASFGDDTIFSTAENSGSGIIESTDTTQLDSVIFKEGPFQIKMDKPFPDTAAKDTSVVITQDNIELDIPHYKQIKRLVKNGITDTPQVLDSLRIENTAWNRFYYGEVIKFAKADFAKFREFLISKFPWIIFFLMPVFALLLKVLYIRRKLLYIDHLIFAFHLHSFLFMTGILYLLIFRITGFEPGTWLTFAALIYLIFAFRNFYQQSWRKTVFKISILLFLYAISALMCFMLSLVIIFLIF